MSLTLELRLQNTKKRRYTTDIKSVQQNHKSWHTYKHIYIYKIYSALALPTYRIIVAVYLTLSGRLLPPHTVLPEVQVEE
jgi:hypothetical protein